MSTFTNKTLLLFLCTLFALQSTVLSAFEEDYSGFNCSGNVLNDGDLESSNIKDHWQFEGNAWRTSSSNNVHTGNKAIGMNNDSGTAGLYQKKAASPGETYSISVYAKSSSGNGDIGIRFLNSNGNIIHDHDVDIPNSSSMKEYTISGTAPAGTAYVQAYGRITGDGTFYVDSYCLQKWTVPSPPNCSNSCENENPFDDPVIFLDPTGTGNGWLGYVNSNLEVCNNGDGTYSIRGSVIGGKDAEGWGGTGNPCGAQDGYYIDLHLTDRQTWAQFGGNYEESAAAPNHEDWDYYKVTGTFTGLGCNSGTTVNILDASMGYRLQVGYGANKHFPNEFGFATWFKSKINGEYVGSDLYGIFDASCYDVCSNLTSGGTIGVDQSACGSSYDPETIQSVSLPSGGSGAIDYVWMKSTTTCSSPSGINDSNWTVISGANNASYNPGSITKSTCYVRLSKRNGCSDYTGKSNVVTVDLYNDGINVNIPEDNTSICSGDEVVLHANTSNASTCGTQGESDCNHSLLEYGGWVENPDHAAYCGQAYGAKLWTKSGEGTSYVVIDFGDEKPSGTTICVNMKLEHCSNTSSNYSDAKIRAWKASSNSYTTLDNSKTFNNSSYKEYCYTLGHSSRYVKVSDNGKCAFRVDYVRTETPGNSNNSVTYAWSGPGITGDNDKASVTVNSPGTYSVTVTDCTGCKAVDEVVITNNNFNADAGADASICIGQSATLEATAVAGATYEWKIQGSTDVLSSSRTFSVSPTVNTTYVLTVSKDGCEDSDYAEVTINDGPSISASNNGPINSATPVVTLSATSNAGNPEWNWDGPSGFSSDEQNPTTSTTGTYYVTVTDLNTGCTNEASTEVTAQPLAPPAETCDASNFTWSSNIVVNGNNVSGDLLMTSSNTLYLIPTNTYPSEFSSQVFISIPEAVSYDGYVGRENTSAQGYERWKVVFVKDGNIVYETNYTEDLEDDVMSADWVGPLMDEVFFPNGVDEIYIAHYEDGNYGEGGQSSANSVRPSSICFDFNGCDDYTVSASNDGPLSSINPEVTLTATTNAVDPTFTWEGPNGFSSNAQNPTTTATGIYYVTVADENGCINTANTEVSTMILPPPAETCDGSNFTWKNNIVVNGNTVTSDLRLKTGNTIYLIPTSTYPSAFSSQVFISIPEAVSYDGYFNRTNAGVQPYEQWKVVFVKNGAVVYETGYTEDIEDGYESDDWVGSLMGEVYFPNGVDEIYIVQYENDTYGEGDQVSPNSVMPSSICFDFSECDVVATADAAPEAICFGGSSTLTASGAGGEGNYTYQWSEGAGSSASVVVSPSETTTYYVTVTDENGCFDVAEVTVIFNDNPDVSIDPAGPICSDEGAIQLTASPAGGAFSGTGVSESGLFDPSISGTGTFTITYDYENEVGCEASASTEIVVNDLPLATAIANPSTICVGESTTLIASATGGSGDYTFEWSDGLGSESTVSVNNLATSSTYTVTVSDLNGCSDVASVEVNVEEKAVVGNFVFTDVDYDGIQDAEDLGLDGVSVTIYEANGTEVESTITANGGAYSFEVCPGEYYIIFGENDGSVRSPQGQTTNDKDSDANPNTGRTENFTLNAGDVNDDIDAGYSAVASVGDYVFWDKDNDGIQDFEDTPIEGVIVTLTDENGNGVVDASGNIVDPIATEADGSYLFDNLYPGKYIVVFTNPDNFIPTKQDASGATGDEDDVNFDSDINSNGESYVVTLDSGENEEDVDAGFSTVADLNLVKRVDNPSPIIGTSVTFTITVANDGPNNATGVSVGDAIPNGYDNIEMISDNGTYNNDEILWSGLSIPANGSIELTFKARVLAPGNDVNYVNIAKIESSDQFDPDSTPGNEADSNGEFGIGSQDPDDTQDLGDEDDGDDAEVNPLSPDITIEKHTNGLDSDEAPGAVIAFLNGTEEEVEWTYYVTNTGNMDLVDVIVTDDIEGYVCTIPSLAVGETQTCTKFGIAMSGLYANIGTVVGTPLDPNTGDPIEDEKVTDKDPSHYRGVRFNIESTVDPTTVCPGETVDVEVAIRLYPDDDGGTDPLLQLRNISFTSQALGLVLTPGDQYFAPGYDTNGDGYLGQDEFEFYWNYTVLVTETVTYEVMDMFDIYFDGNKVGSQMAMDSYTVTADPANCASLGDYVWFDADADGIQDPNEDGVNGITVNLYIDSDLNGTPDGGIIATTMTANNPNTGNDGFYEFTGLLDDGYIVEFVDPAGDYLFSPANEGQVGNTDPANDSDADPTTGRTEPIMLAKGENNPDIDAGIFLPASIGNLVWNDINANGVQDPGEPGIFEAVVLLTNELGISVFDLNGDVVDPQITDNNGMYLFENLAPGNYQVMFIKPTGLLLTQANTGGFDTDATDIDGDSDASPITGKSHIINLEAGEQNNNIDAGYYNPGSIGDYVWNDEDGDGVQDANEDGVNGITVNLYTDEDMDGEIEAGQDPIETTVTTTNPNTNEDGYYLFDELPAGKYLVEFVTDGYVVSPQDQGGNDAADSDVDPETKLTSTIVLDEGEDDTTIDAGIYIGGALGDLVWQENASDNPDSYDAGVDIPLGGVVVYLFKQNDLGDFILIGDTETNANGGYIFDNLPKGVYQVEFVNPGTGLTFVTQNVGSEDVDSDADSDGLSDQVLLGAGEINLNVDAGLTLAPVPVELVSFTGKWNSETDVNELKWQTSSEINNDYFEIERSFGNTGSFSAIAKVTGNGTTFETQNYDVVDRNIDNNGIYFYRLKQYDYDGTFAYSDIIAIRVERDVNTEISVYPNPSTSFVNVDVTTAKQDDIRIQLFDLSGKLVKTETLNAGNVQYDNTVRIDVQDLPSGIYNIITTVGTNIFNDRINVLD